MLAYEVERALTRWEPRIDVDRVTVDIDSTDRSRLLIDIQYTLKTSNDPRNLVFPFYLK